MDIIQRDANKVLRCATSMHIFLLHQITVFLVMLTDSSELSSCSGYNSTFGPVSLNSGAVYRFEEVIHCLLCTVDIGRLMGVIGVSCD